jgi:hypothetical protein
MNYTDYVLIKISKLSIYDLANCELDACKMRKSQNAGEQSIGESYMTAICTLLKSKNHDYLRKYSSIRSMLNGQKRIY